MLLVSLSIDFKFLKDYLLYSVLKSTQFSGIGTIAQPNKHILHNLFQDVTDLFLACRYKMEKENLNVIFKLKSPSKVIVLMKENV